MTSPHAYKILGLSQDSDKQEIKKKYRRLMHQVHPDASFRLRACCISSVLRIFDRRSASGRIINLADDFSVFYQIIHISANRDPGQVYFTGDFIAAHKSSLMFFQISTDPLQGLLLKPFLKHNFLCRSDVLIL